LTSRHGWRCRSRPSCHRCSHPSPCNRSQPRHTL